MRAAARLVKAGRSESYGGSVRFSEEASEAARRGPRWRIVARPLHDAGGGHAMCSRLGLGVIGLTVALVAMALAAPAEARRKDKAPVFPLEAFRENESTADWLAAHDLVAWQSSDLVLKEPADRVAKLGPEWFCFQDAQGAWVRRRAYRFTPDVINGGLRKLIGLAGLEVEDRPAVISALARHADGMDFADAVHLASSSAATAFATFDGEFAKGARRADAAPPVRLL